ncbi:hypothetical protein HMPREF0262_01414 [Clostridium sp. ATCC 29733]|nr:hypothetical protein HMPREF0262_01414 [Clostridium sp. ATCC 29733]
MPAKGGDSGKGGSGRRHFTKGRGAAAKNMVKYKCMAKGGYYA